MPTEINENMPNRKNNVELNLSCPGLLWLAVCPRYHGVVPQAQTASDVCFCFRFGFREGTQPKRQVKAAAAAK